MPTQPISADATDNRLIQACLAGERAAWDVLVARYAALVIGTARRSGATPTLADDVMQTVFAVLVRRLGAIDDPSALPQWLIVTTKRTTWRMARSAGVVVSHEERSDDFGASGGAGRNASAGESLPTGGSTSAEDRLDPTALLLANERAAVIRRQVDELTEPCRQIIRALFFEQPPPDYAALSVRLDVPIGSLGPTRARCLKRLSDRLENTDGSARR